MNKDELRETCNEWRTEIFRHIHEILKLNDSIHDAGFQTEFYITRNRHDYSFNLSDFIMNKNISISVAFRPIYEKSKGE